MNLTYHVLNGDALRERFPTEILGERIVFRECLVDGPVKAKDLTDFFEIRGKFLSANHGELDSPDYTSYVISEFNKLLGIEQESEVNLWFEDDLFCQVNLWFAIHLLKGKNVNLFLVKPDRLSPYSFADYDQEALRGLLNQRVLIQTPEAWSQLWLAYSNNDLELLMEQAKQMGEEFPFLEEAVEAHVDRAPADEPGRPEQALLQIMDDLKTKEFSLVFREFTKREPIYGFGDVQVKRLFDSLV